MFNALNHDQKQEVKALVQSTQGGKNVSTALFDAIINTAFDYDMFN